MCVYVCVHTHIHNELLFINKSKWNIAICRNKHEHEDYYAFLNRKRKTNINTMWYHLYVESKK